MKTNEQKVQEYLQKTSLHLFQIGKELRKTIYTTTKSGTPVAVNLWFDLESQYTNVTLGTYPLSCIKTYEGNAKCVTKHELFLNKEAKSIRNRKAIYLKVEEITKLINSIEDRSGWSSLIEDLKKTMIPKSKSFLEKVLGK